MIIWGRLISAREIEIRIQHPFIQICIIPEEEAEAEYQNWNFGKKEEQKA